MSEQQSEDPKLYEVRQMKAFVFLAVAALAGCSMGNPGDGDKVGQVARVMSEGVFCRTTTVHITGKYGGGELTVTVPSGNQTLEAAVRHYNDTQEQIKAYYHTDLIKGACSNETENRMLVSIEPHPEGAAPEAQK